ncbi:MAG: CBS domain-containing protein [Gammaproteobacteria bacterium]|nr:CBS domain-containing protein [Gammaproteobacteria bacterium]
MMRKDKIEQRETFFPSVNTDTWVGGAPVRLLVRGEPRVLKPDSSLREALFQFGWGRATACVVAEQKDRPLGIVVLSDLLRAITMHRVDLEEPIYAHMIAAPATLPADASVHRARVTFTRGHLDHLLLVEADGRMQGLLSPSDLPGYREGGAEDLVDRIMRANDVERMATAAYAVRERASELFNNGMGVEILFGWMSGLNDLINIRVIELVANEFDLPPVSWCWMVFGSEGRVEQGFATDQDNGLIFQPDREEDTDEIRRAFLPFTQAVNLGLNRCGFKLCPGNIMAGNPEWCLSSREWHERFSNWMAMPEPEAILKATIFFDFRPLYGQDELADDLRQWLMPQPAQHPRFLHLLAEQSRTASPALNWLGQIVCDNVGSPHGVDLKKRGTRIFVDAARIWALQLGLFTTSTVERLRLSGPAMHRATGDTNASIEALDILQRLRLQRQLAGGDAASINRVDPRELTRPQRMLLKEAFKQARQLQWTLQRTFP